ncbi:MAG: PQQ-dependent sugar dehydrogenase, partial [Chloroflexi bacterium]|nr:PQQ-dependent sugar dehydrogenase [Chloroflexota bacterium]
LARYNVSANPNVADSNSGQVIMTIPHPNQGNHNGGWIAFGPDDNLYLAPGDGGGSNDQYCNAQNVTRRLGKLLRIDVIGQVTYTIPASNAFTPTQAPEVWAIGLRNPFRNSFDRLTGDLYVADVGQNAWEEVNYVPAGSGAGINFGWSQYEGTAPFNSGCPSSGILPTPPVVVHAHSVTGDDNCSITGGYVYRGLSQWWLYGAYFYGDWCSGRIWALWQPTPGVFNSIQVTDTTHRIASFGEDVSGEIYVADLAGAVYRLTSTVTGVTPTNLTSVSVTGPASSVTVLPYTFSATANPVSTTLPLTYTWQADDHTVVTHTGGLSDSVTLDWAVSGTKVITVTATNAGGSMVEDTHTIVIAEAQKYYFPLILRN